MRRKEHFPLLYDLQSEIIYDPYADSPTTLSLFMEGALRRALGEEIADTLLADIQARYFFRRVNEERPCREEQNGVRYLTRWVFQFIDIVNTKVVPFNAIRNDYQNTLHSALTDNGRNETRALYAAPNGTPSLAYCNGQEVVTVTGEWAEGLDRAEKFLSAPNSTDVMLSFFEPLFLGVL